MFSASKPDPKDPHQLDGKVRIEILSGRKLTDKAYIGTQSPYLILKVGPHRMVTKVHNHGGLEPKWNQAFEFNVKGTENQVMAIEVRAKETFNDTTIGKRQVRLYDFWKKCPPKGGWWRIHSKQYIHKIRGEIYFRCRVNGKTYQQQNARRASAQIVSAPAAPPPPSVPKPKMIWQVALPDGVTVRTEPSLTGTKVSYDGKTCIVLPQGTLLDSSLIHKSYSKLKNGKFLATYWIRHGLGWSCCKYGHSQVMIPLSEFKIYEVIARTEISVRTMPGLGAPRSQNILHPGQVILGRQTESVKEAKGAVSTWILHGNGWSCAALGKENFMVQIMFRKAFQVVLKQGVTIRNKPSLKAKVIGELKHMQCAVSREIKQTQEGDKAAVWMRTRAGWSCLKLSNLVTMIPLGQGKAWWEVTAPALSLRCTPGVEGQKTKTVLKKHLCLVSRGLYPLPFEKAYWLKLQGGYSCFKLKQEELMRLKCGVEAWEVVNEAGLYIRSKPGGKKHILGFLPKGELILSRYMVKVLDDNFPPTIWVRHGRGWTCIQLGEKWVARPVIPSSLENVKQRPIKTYNLKEIHEAATPIHFDPSQQHDNELIGQVIAVKTENKAVQGQVLQRHASSEQELVDNNDTAHAHTGDEIPEAEGVAVIIGEPQIINPPKPQTAPAVVAAVQVQRPTSTVDAEAIADNAVSGEVVG